MADKIVSAEHQLMFGEKQVGIMHKVLINTFRDAGFIKSDSYTFSDRLFPFASVMLGHVYAIRIHRSRTDARAILQKVQELKYRRLHKFRTELDADSRYLYLYFVPVNKVQLQNLITDYITITNTITGSDISTVIRKQYYLKRLVFSSIPRLLIPDRLFPKAAIAR